MQELKKNIKAHLFICCRQREDKACCSKKGAEQIISELKIWLKESGLKDKIKVSKSSCLGYCESGIAACIYPQNKWLHKITAQDLTEIKELLKECAK